MIFDQTKIRAASTIAALSVMSILAAQPISARTRVQKPDYQVLGQAALPGGKTTDLFLRQSQDGRTFLYVASVNQTMAVFDVTNNAEPHQVNRLVLSATSNAFTFKPIGERLAIASAAADPAHDFTVLDLNNAPSVQIAKTLKNVDAYTINGTTNTAYVAQDGRLTVMRFGHPVTRDAEIWEQFFQTR
jgi:hypothetical protein